MNVLIIGASRGIGAGIAEAYAKLGHNLFLASRDVQELVLLSEKLSNKYGVQCNYSFIDVKDKMAIANAYDKCQKAMSVPDIVIYNSGVSKTDNFLEFESQRIKDIYRVNVFGMIDAMEVILPSLLSADKQVYFAGVTSLAEARGIPGNAGYSSSKVAASHILEAARCQLHNSNVKIITVKPGFVKTKMTQNNKFYMPMVMDSDRAGEIIAEGIMRGKSIVAFPTLIQFASYLAKTIPSCIYDGVMKFWKKKKILED